MLTPVPNVTCSYWLFCYWAVRGYMEGWDLVQSLFKVCYDILFVLETNGEPYASVNYANFFSLLHRRDLVCH